MTRNWSVGESHGPDHRKAHNMLETLVVNVKDADYGAVGDGIVDDSTAIQAAITAAGAGGHVFYPAGTYRVGSLAPLNGQVWTGVGKGLSILKAKTAATEVVLMSGLVQNRFSGLSFDGNAAASKGVVMAGSGVSGSRSHLFDKCRFAFCSTGLSVEQGAVTQVDKNTYLSCDFEDNTTGARINSVNAQEQLFIGCGFATQTTGLQATNGTATLLGCQFGTSSATHILIDGPFIWLNLRDVICEGGPCDIDGSTAWPSSGVVAEHSIFQGSVDTVRIGSGGSLFVARHCVFNTGGVNATANDTVFIDEFNSFGSGAAYESTGVNNHRHKRDSDGLKLNGPDFATWGVRTGLELGNPGTAAMDTNLYREAANILKTDDRFKAVGGVDTRVVATASLPAAAAAMDGHILIEDAGAGDRNIIIYAGGQRFRLDGGAAF